MLAEVRGRTTDDPRRWFYDADAVLRILEVVNIGSVVLCTSCSAGYQLGKLSCEGDGRRCRTVQQRQGVEHIGEPLRLGLPVDMQSPQGVLQGFTTHSHLRCQGLFRQVLQRTTNLEVLGEIVLPVDTEHTFSLHTVVVVRLQRDVDTSTCIDDALVEDGHLAGSIIDGIVATLAQRHTTCRYFYRTLRNVVCPQRDNVGRGSLKLSGQEETVLVCHLLGSSAGGVVKFLEGILLSYLLGDAAAHQEILQRSAEGFY